MAPAWVLDCPDLAATLAAGRRLGATAMAGGCLALVGPLGAGKTALTQGLAAGLGVTEADAVSSPTFVLLHEYAGRLPVLHFDAYRLRSPAEFEDLGAAELLAGDGVCVIEWADRVAALLPADRLTVVLAAAPGAAGDGTGRTLTATATGARHAAWLERWKAS